MEEETSRQMFDKVRARMDMEAEGGNDISKYQTDGSDLIDLNAEMQGLVGDIQIYQDIENDRRDVERFFSGDMQLEPFKIKFEVYAVVT
jgi:hypothetical protein